MATMNPATSASAGKTPAQILQEKHEAAEAHRPTVEDTVDEEDILHPPPSLSTSATPADSGVGTPAPVLSERAAGKQKAQEPINPPGGLDTKSEEAFPSLGGPKARPAAATWGAAPTWGAKRNIPSTGTNGTVNGYGAAPPVASTISSRASTPSSGVQTPASNNASAVPRRGPQSMALPGQHTDYIQLAPSQLVRNKVAKPVLDDINRKSRARISQRAGPNQSVIFEARGSANDVRQALKRVSKELGVPQTLKIPVPISVRPHIIGKGGAVIQDIMQKSGARIQVPKTDETAGGGDEDDSVTVDVEVSGDPISASEARQRIEDIVSQRTSNVNLRLKEIPAEFFPFIAGPHNRNISGLEQDNLTIDIPQYHTWRGQPPPRATGPQERPTFVPHPDLHIRLAGDREAAQAARREIEKQVERLRQQLILDEQNIQRAQHQFIIGERGMSPHEFLEETGCAILLPSDAHDTEDVTIIGPADRIQDGVNKVLELASAMGMQSIDPRPFHKAAGGTDAHARALARYLAQRQHLLELEQLHNAHVALPSADADAVQWQIFAKDAQNALRARNDLIKIIQAHPPSRIAQFNADPFFHPHIRNHLEEQILNELGVRLVAPADDDVDHVLLVFEGIPQAETPFQLSRQRPGSPEERAFRQALAQAQKQIVELIKADQQDLSSADVKIPRKFHDKVRRFVKQPTQAPASGFPVKVRYGAPNDTVSLRGPTPSVNDLEAKLRAFLREAEAEELERGYTTTLDFPSKFANQLIGQRGQNINRLREEFDVDIQVDKSGKVEIKGPQAKAERCKKHIESFGKKLEDEVFYTIKVDPKYHRDLIGLKGASVRKLEERYPGVHVQFPTSKNVPDDQSVADTASEIGGRRGRHQPTDEVWIRGPRKESDTVRTEILDLVQYYKDQSHTATVSVAKKQLPSLLGKGGSEMSALRYETGAKIDVPSAQDTADASDRVEIKVKGTKEQVEKAKAALQQRAKAFDEITSRSIDVDKKYHQNLIGAGGSNIRRIVLDAGGPDNSAKIVRFPDRTSESSTIKIEGPKALVDKVYESISSFVQQRENQVSDSIDVPTEKHRSLIGRGGEVRRGIEEQFKISLDIPKQGSGRTAVKLTGASTDVAKAKEHIAGLVKGQAGETIQVPKGLHHTVAQNGNFFRQLRNSHEVTVDHGGQKPPPRPKTAPRQRPSVNGNTPLITDDPSAAADAHQWDIVDNSTTANGDLEGTISWILSGSSPENVTTAKSLIEKALAEASKPSATGYLTLPDPRSYRLVVGPGGREINRIRDKTGCKIQVPKANGKGGLHGDAEDAIEIVGSKEGVEEAKEMILETVKRSGNA